LKIEDELTLADAGPHTFRVKYQSNQNPSAFDIATITINVACVPTLSLNTPAPELLYALSDPAAYISIPELVTQTPDCNLPPASYSALSPATPSVIVDGDSIKVETSNAADATLPPTKTTYSLDLTYSGVPSPISVSFAVTVFDPTTCGTRTPGPGPQPLSDMVGTIDPTNPGAPLAS